MAHHLHPLGMHRLSPESSGGNLFLQIGHSISVTVEDSLGIIVLQAGSEQSVKFSRGKLVQSIGIRGLPLPDHIKLFHAPSVFRHRNGKFPALDLKNNSHGLDAPLIALCNELRIVHISVKAESGIHLPKGLVFQIGERNGTSPHHGPYQDSAFIFLQILHHTHAAKRQAGMIAVIVTIPSVKINTSFHASSPCPLLYLYIRSIWA